METGYSTISERPVQLWISASLLEGRLDAEFYQPIYLRALDSVRSTGFPTRPLVEVCVDKFRVYWGIKGLDNPPSATHIPYIRPNEVADDGWIEYDNLTTIERHWVDDLPGAVVRPGDLLVEVKGNARKVHIVRDDVPPFTFVSGSMYRFVPSDEVDVQYLWTYLTSQTCQTIKARLMSNSIIKWINPEDICQLPVPLPPKPVQEHIGAKVRLAERCRTRAQEESQLGEQLLYDYLQLPPIQESFTLSWWVDPIRHEFDRLTPKNYLPKSLAVESELNNREAQPLGDLIRKKDGISNGATPRGASYVDEGIPFLRVQNITRNFVDLSSAVHITVEMDEELKHSRVKPLDVILTITGYPGTAAVATSDLLPLNINQHSVRLGLKSDINPFYVAAFLNSDYGYVQVQQRSTGATRDALNYGAVKSLKVLLLPKDQQDEVGRHFEVYGNLLRNAQRLVREAKADVEALIEGQLDAEGIVAGRVQPPTWEDLEV